MHQVFIFFFIYIHFRRFYRCDDGHPFQSFCPAGLHWDDVRKFCTYKNEAVCGPVEAPKKDKVKEVKLRMMSNI